MKKESKYQEYFLEKLMESSKGNRLGDVLEGTIAEEKKCLEQFELQISICRSKLKEINDRISLVGPTHSLMTMKRVFEEQECIINVAAQFQQCSYETKGIQKLLYFEKNESARERILVDAFELMHEWCEDLNQLTGKKIQDIAFKLLAPSELTRMRIARKKLKDYYDEEKKVLANVRNNMGAHREHDFLKQREVLYDINWMKTIERLHVFEVITLEFGESLKPLMDAGMKQIEKAFGKE